MPQTAPPDLRTSADLERESTSLTPVAHGPAMARGSGWTLAGNLSVAIQLSDRFALSNIVPTQYRKQPADCLVAILLGEELGLPPIAALQSIAVINGRPGLYAEGFLGVIMAAPKYDRHREYFVRPDGSEVDALTPADLQNDLTRAVAMFWRKGNPDPFVGTFSVADAKVAKLWRKAGPWTDYPSRMLKMRARGFGGRDAFPAELRGIRLVEELSDYVDAESTTVVPAPPPAPPVRRSAKLAAPTTTIDDEPSAPPDPREPEPSPPAREPGDEPPDETTDIPTAPHTTPPPSKPTPEPNSANGGVIEHLVIVDTAFVKPPTGGGDPYYKIRARVDLKGAPPMSYDFVSRDQTIYDLAASAEGTRTPFTVTWKRGKLPNGSACKILEELAAG